MNIGGFLKQSFVDFPANISAVIFTNGCNFDCWYCHNKGLLSLNNKPKYNFDEIYQFLESRKNFLDGVVISGGEPTLQKDLEEVIDKIGKYEVKIIVKDGFGNESFETINFEIVDENIFGCVDGINCQENNYATGLIIAGILITAIVIIVLIEVFIIKKNKNIIRNFFIIFSLY